MRKIVVGSIVVVLAIGGCSFSKKNREGQEVPYAKNAILVDLQSGKDLNTFNEQPHTLVLVVYQLADPNMFNQMLEEPEGIARLLEAGAFDASVLSRRRIVVQPEEHQKLYLDRAAGVRYLGIVAGYYSQKRKELSRLVPFAIREKSKFFWHGKDDEKADTIISLNLGRNGILSN